MAIREKRAVKRSLFTPGSRKYWDLKTEHARVLFVAILVNADDEGRLEGDPEDIKTLIPRASWPLEDILSYLRDLKKVELIDYYRVKGRWYIEVVGFWEHQDRHGVSQEPSRLPRPPRKEDVVVEENQSGVQEQPSGKILASYLASSSRCLDSYDGKGESERETKFNWSNFAKKYKHLIGKKAQDHKKNRELYNEVCLKYGEGVVLAALERCLPDQSEEFQTKGVFAWKFLTEIVHDFIEEPKHGTDKKYRSKAEQREENNRQVLKDVLGGT